MTSDNKEKNYFDYLIIEYQVQEDYQYSLLEKSCED